MRMNRLILALVLVLGLAGEAWGADLFVSQDGAGDGTTVSTPDSIADFNAGNAPFDVLDDDIVYFLDAITTTPDCTDNGTAGHLITLRGDYPGRECTITSAGTQGIEINVDYIVVRGFTVVGGTSTGIRLSSTVAKNSVLITDNIVHDTTGDGIHIRMANAFAGIEVSYNTVYSFGTDNTGIGIFVYSDNNDDANSAITDGIIHHNTVYNTGQTGQDGIRLHSQANDAAFSGADVYNNTVYDIEVESGIEAYGAVVMSDINIYSNEVYNTKGNGVHIGSGTAITPATVYSNNIHDCGDDAGVDASGILFDSNSDASVAYKNLIVNSGESGVKISSTNSCVVYNNKILESYDHGIEIRTTGPFTSDSHEIYNNTIYHNGIGNGIDVDEGSPGTGGAVLVKNNAVLDYGDSPAGIYIRTTAVVTEQYNRVYGFTTNFADEEGAIAAGTGSAALDPLFTSAATSDFTLQALSPCINTGVDLTASGVTDDYSGTARPQAGLYDIGAYERAYSGGELDPLEGATTTLAIVTSSGYLTIDNTTITTQQSTIVGPTTITEDTTATNVIFAGPVILLGDELTATNCAFAQSEAEIEALGGTVTDTTCLFSTDSRLRRPTGDRWWHFMPRNRLVYNAGTAIGGVTTDYRGLKFVGGTPIGAVDFRSWDDD